MVKVEIRYLNPESPPPSYTTLDVSSGVCKYNLKWEHSVTGSPDGTSPE